MVTHARAHTPAQLAGAINTPTAFLPKGRSPPTKCPEYDIKLSESEPPALEIWGSVSTTSLPLLPGPL